MSESGSPRRLSKRSVSITMDQLIKSADAAHVDLNEVLSQQPDDETNIEEITDLVKQTKSVHKIYLKVSRQLISRLISDGATAQANKERERRQNANIECIEFLDLVNGLRRGLGMDEYSNFDTRSQVSTVLGYTSGVTSL